jgi:hypothetical protein
LLGKGNRESCFGKGVQIPVNGMFTDSVISCNQIPESNKLQIFAFALKKQ